MHQMLAQMSSLADHGNIPPDFQLTEDAKTATIRASLEDRVEKLKGARQTINELVGVLAWRHSSMSSYVTAVTAGIKVGGSGPDAGSVVDGSYCFAWPDDVPAGSMAAFDVAATQVEEIWGCFQNILEQQLRESVVCRVLACMLMMLVLVRYLLCV